MHRFNELMYDGIGTLTMLLRKSHGLLKGELQVHRQPSRGFTGPLQPRGGLSVHHAAIDRFADGHAGG